MTDFRVLLPSSDAETGVGELDWEQTSGVWRRSEKEFGEVSWAQNLMPTDDDLGYLREYFRVDATLTADSLLHLSPGELGLLHSETHAKPTVIASLCLICGQHWTVYRLEAEQWRMYGRTCDFSWARGVVVDPSGDDSLKSLLQMDD